MRHQERALWAFVLKAGAPGLLVLLAPGETVCAGTHHSSWDSRALSGFFEAMIPSISVLLAQVTRPSSLHSSFALPSPAWQKAE